MDAVIKNIYVIPEFSDTLIDDITNDNDIIYNKNYKQETYKAQPLFYINFTRNERTIKLFAFGYKPDKYKNIDNLGNLYLVSDDWFVISGFQPFKKEQFYKLMFIIYYFNNHLKK